jgi:hypothetical protein
MSYDNFVQREHSRAFNAGPICENCWCEEEVHDAIGLCECGECDGFLAHDPRDDERDEPRED